MNITDISTLQTIWFEGFSYVKTLDGTVAKGCRRCGGTGHYSFNGFDSICYLCRNVWAERLGYIFDTEAQAQAWCHGKALDKARREARKERERLAQLAKRDSAWQALKDAHPGVWALLSDVLGVAIPYVDGMGKAEVTERNSFVVSMAAKLWTLDERPLSANMVVALEREVANRANPEFQVPAPAGRVVVTGEVVSTKIVDSDYGVSYKMLVKADEGYKVWVSIPNSLLETTTLEEAKGRRVTFMATLEPSQDDASFAFGKRPTKGSWI